eukprot:CAMPEP_0170143574 /NCGR_PEP_ID=MMETSP0033_2-20121228/11727_1 /TAXON_ID=195969 /ORGANISM="Dolichomastix tenuilepis, Strain CCMP3274" /LENGTH=245 /DNA_ID=CAMNT_0010380031 /DNA_START=44 /DNA_END=781 /DNA_ORIENTATION=+
MTSERAIRDVFSTTSYVTIGEKEKPLDYGKKEGLRSCYTSKQFMTNPPKQGNLGAKVPEVYLEREHKWVMSNVQYTDKIWYKDLQKEKKKGFLSGDFKRRDEYSLNFTTEQYRERLKNEYHHQSSTTAKYKELREFLEDEVKPETAPAGATKKPLLFDLVYDGNEANPTAVKNSMISGRDTKNPTQLSWNRSYGQLKPSSQDVGYGIHSAHHGKPQFARIPLVKSTFYRPSSIPIINTLYTQRPK